MADPRVPDAAPENGAAQSPIRIAFFGDVVGEPGRKALAERLPSFRIQYETDLVVANGENAAGGRGITPRICIGLLRAGVSVVTTGDHIWDQPEIIDYIDTEPRLLRPINFPPGTPGQGSIVLPTPKGPVAVVNALGRTFTKPTLDNPFNILEEEVARLREKTHTILVDFHAEATSEKIALGRMLDGTVSAVVGTHTHVQTADEQIFPGGTAFLCDVGMCGPEESVLGRRINPVIETFRTSMPARFPVAKGPVRLCAAILSVDRLSGRALSIERFSEQMVSF